MSKDEEIQDDDGREVPCVEVIVSGTMALMTGFAMSDSAQHRSLMGRKIRSNLFFLAHHPALTDSFRCVVQNMHAHWCALVEQLETPPALVEPLAEIAKVRESKLRSLH